MHKIMALGCHTTNDGEQNSTESSYTSVHSCTEPTETEGYLAPDYELQSVSTVSTLESSISTPPLKHGKNRRLGLACALVSAFLFSITSLLVKMLGHICPFQLTTMRFVGIVLPILPILSCTIKSKGLKKYLFPQKMLPFLFIRALIGSIAMMLRYYAIQKLPLSDVSVILFSAPIFVALFARIFLNEMCGVILTASVALTTAGLVIIVRSTLLNASDADPLDWTGLVAAFLSTLLGSGLFAVLRKLQNVPVVVVFFHFGVIALIVTGSTTLVVQDCLCMPMCWDDRLLVLSISLSGFGGQALLIMSLKLKKSGPVSILLTTDVIFAFMWQHLFFKDNTPITTSSIVGAVLVILSGVLIGLQKWVLALPVESLTRKRFSWLLE